MQLIRLKVIYQPRLYQVEMSLWITELNMSKYSLIYSS